MALDRFSKEPELDKGTLEEISTEESVVLDTDGQTGPERFAFQRIERAALEAQEIELKIHLVHMSGVGGDTRHLRNAFSEHMGVVARKGNDAGVFNLGDRVLALGNDNVATYRKFDLDRAIRIPDSIEFEDFIGFKSALVAYHALVKIANLSAGDRVLIDHSLGHVGIFAIQVAK